MKTDPSLSVEEVELWGGGGETSWTSTVGEMGTDSKGAERQWAPLCRKLHPRECWEGPGLLCSLLWPQCLVSKRHSVMIQGFNLLITEGDRGSWESWDMWLRTVRGVCGPLTRQQGLPSVWEVGSHRHTLARARVKRTGVGRQEEVGEAERLLLQCTASAGAGLGAARKAGKCKACCPGENLWQTGYKRWKKERPFSLYFCRKEWCFN